MNRTNLFDLLKTIYLKIEKYITPRFFLNLFLLFGFISFVFCLVSGPEPRLEVYIISNSENSFQLKEQIIQHNEKVMVTTIQEEVVDYQIPKQMIDVVIIGDYPKVVSHPYGPHYIFIITDMINEFTHENLIRLKSDKTEVKYYNSTQIITELDSYAKDKPFRHPVGGIDYHKIPFFILFYNLFCITFAAFLINGGAALSSTLIQESFSKNSEATYNSIIKVFFFMIFLKMIFLICTWILNRPILFPIFLLDSLFFARIFEFISLQGLIRIILLSSGFLITTTFLLIRNGFEINDLIALIFFPIFIYLSLFLFQISSLDVFSPFPIIILISGDYQPRLDVIILMIMCIFTPALPKLNKKIGPILLVFDSTLVGVVGAFILNYDHYQLFMSMFSGGIIGIVLFYLLFGINFHGIKDQLKSIFLFQNWRRK